MLSFIVWLVNHCLIQSLIIERSVLDILLFCLRKNSTVPFLLYNLQSDILDLIFQSQVTSGGSKPTNQQQRNASFPLFRVNCKLTRKQIIIKITQSFSLLSEAIRLLAGHIGLPLRVESKTDLRCFFRPN